MKAEAAIPLMEVGEVHKFVAQLTPGMIWLAKKSSQKYHSEMAVSAGLATFTRSAEEPYRLNEPKNFKAGRLCVKDGVVHVAGYSADFPDKEYAITDDATLQGIFDNAEIKFL